MASGVFSIFEVKMGWWCCCLPFFFCHVGLFLFFNGFKICPPVGFQLRGNTNLQIIFFFQNPRKFGWFGTEASWKLWKIIKISHLKGKQIQAKLMIYLSLLQQLNQNSLSITVFLPIRECSSYCRTWMLIHSLWSCTRTRSVSC